MYMYTHIYEQSAGAYMYEVGKEKFIHDLYTSMDIQKYRRVCVCVCVCVCASFIKNTYQYVYNVRSSEGKHWNVI